MSSLSRSFDAEHEGPNGTMCSPSVTLNDALKAEAAAYRASARFITHEAAKWRAIDDHHTAEVMDKLAADLTKHARRIRRKA